MTNQDSILQEAEISLLFKNATAELDAIEEESHKEKKQVVIDLAKHLEGMIPTNTICQEIATQLRGRVSERFIRECLDDKYKQKYRSDNAKKQQKVRKQANLAALTPLNQEEDARSKEIFIAQDTRGRSTEEIKSIPDFSQDYSGAGNDNNRISGQQELRARVQQDLNDLNECSNCKQLLLENHELQEALEKASKLTTADNMHAVTALDHIHNIDPECDILDFKFCVSKKQILDGWGEPYVELKDGDLEVWFSGKIDRRDCRINSVGTGRKN